MHLRLFRRKELPHVLAANALGSLHLLIVLGFRVVSAVVRLTIQDSTPRSPDVPLHSVFVTKDHHVLVAAGALSELKRLSIH